MDIEKVLAITARGILMAMAGLFLGSLAGTVIGVVIGASIGPFDYMLDTAPDAEHKLMATAMKWFMGWTPMGAVASFVMGAVAGAASGAHLGGIAGTALSFLGTSQRWLQQLSRRGGSSYRAVLTEVLGMFYGPLGGAMAGTVLGWLAGLFSRLVANPVGPSFTLAFLGPEGGALIGLAIGVVVGPMFLRRAGPASARTAPVLIGILCGVSIAGSIGLIVGALAGWYFERWQSKLGERWREWPVGIAGGVICGFFVGGFDGILLGGLMGWVVENWILKKPGAPLTLAWVGPPPTLIHIAREGRVRGPYTRQQVREQLRGGMLRSNEWAWAPGAPGWLGLHSIPLGETALSSPAAPVEPAEIESRVTTVHSWRRSLFSAASTGFNVGVVSGALLGATTILYAPASFLPSVFLGVLVGGLVVALGAALVAEILRRAIDVANNTKVDLGAALWNFSKAFVLRGIARLKAA